MVVRNGFPFRRSDDGKLHVSFEVRLIETREDSIGRIRLKVSVEILFALRLKTD